MFLVVDKRKLLISLGVILLVCLLGVTAVSLYCVVPKKDYVIVIDAGHGGGDGGVKGTVTGVSEAEINLLVAFSLKNKLEKRGARVVMTREKNSVLDNGIGTKTDDFEKRKKIISQTVPDVVISIHQNKFPEAQYWGAQVFYSPNTEDSRALAECVREKVVSLVQPTNKRELKRGTDSVYLLYHAERPMVLVECGFLSNAEELARLKDGVYRQKLAFAVAAGTMTYIG